MSLALGADAVRINVCAIELNLFSNVFLFPLLSPEDLSIKRLSTRLLRDWVMRSRGVSFGSLVGGGVDGGGGGVIS